jgi:hypothetical protein
LGERSGVTMVGWSYPEVRLRICEEMVLSCKIKPKLTQDASYKLVMGTSRCCGVTKYPPTRLNSLLQRIDEMRLSWKVVIYLDKRVSPISEAPYTEELFWLLATDSD